LRYHADERGVKVVGGLMFHEPLEKLIKLLFPGEGTKPPTLKAPVFIAGGWDSPEKRQREIDLWRRTPGHGVLLCNMLANSMGLDLAEGEVQVNGELAWV